MLRAAFGLVAAVYGIVVMRHGIRKADGFYALMGALCVFAGLLGVFTN